MKKTLFLCTLAAAVGLLAAAPAHADSTFDLTFSGCLGNSYNGNCYGTSFADGGDVTFTVAGDPSTPGSGYNSYDITAITGTMGIGSDTYTITGLDSGFGSLGGDNNLYLSSTGNYSFDASGLDFTLAGTGNYDEFRLFNFFGNGAQGQYSYTYNCGTQRHPKTCTASGQVYGTLTETISSGTPSDPPSSTPEPGSLALLGTAILGGAGVLRRRFLA